MTFIEELLSKVPGETVVGIVIGAFGWEAYNEELELAGSPKGKVMSLDEAKHFLSYEYESSYGAPKCHAVTMWTSDSIVFVVQYDGSTGVCSIPRNPTDHIPIMPGGG